MPSHFRRAAFGALLALLVATIGCGKKKESGVATPTEATMAELNQAYSQWEMLSVGPPPKVVEGLTNSYLLKDKRLPNVPPGKKLALDPVKRQVVIVNE